MNESYIQQLETKACDIVFSATADQDYENQLTQQLIFLTLGKLILKANVPAIEEKLYRLLSEVPISFQKELEKPGIHRNISIYRKLRNKKYFQGVKTSILIRREANPTYLLAVLAHEEDHAFNEGTSRIDRNQNKVVYRTGFKIIKSQYESALGNGSGMKIRNFAIEELCTVRQSQRMRDVAVQLKNVNLKYLGKLTNQIEPQAWYLGYPTLRTVANDLFLYLEPMLEDARQSGNLDHVANMYNQVVKRENAFETVTKRLDRLYKNEINQVQGVEAMGDWNPNPNK